MTVSLIMAPDCTAQDSREKDRWLSRDKGQHFVVSLLLTGATGTLLVRRCGYHRDQGFAGGAVLTLGAGLIKEWRDSRRLEGRFSWKDLAADLLGIILGGWLLIW